MMAKSSSTFPPRTRYLWADLCDDDDDGEEWESSQFATSSDGGHSNTSDSKSPTRAYVDDFKQASQSWPTGGMESLPSAPTVVMGPLSSTSSATVSWSVADAPTDAPTDAQGSSCPSEATIDAPIRRSRVKNRKSEKSSVVGSSGKESKTKHDTKNDNVNVSAEATVGTPTHEKVKAPGEFSVGSAKHDTGGCRRCLFYDSPVGCVKGVDCDFCHLQHFRSSCTRPSKAKRERYTRLFQEIADKRAKAAAEAEELSF
mmetsp:Transcript_19985/g.43455  ORF Transcript_19985/g.43455 Transcript_19985/m.43455 type:complete len:257 (-) Transcript_19985:294-1064(-)